MGLFKGHNMGFGCSNNYGAASLLFAMVGWRSERGMRDAECGMRMWIDSFLNTPTAGRGAHSVLYPLCIQAQRTVDMSKIA
jgi:hypothetical protein